MASLEQRKRFEETVGDRVKGFADGQLRMAGTLPPACDACGGPVPCSACASAPAAPAAQRTKRRAPLVDHTATARQEYDLMLARERTREHV
jgi:hypothetical protein